MPRASAWLVRAALVHLVAAFTTGAIVLGAKAGALPPPVAGLHPAHVELVLAGWMLQLVLGVATWILPRRADHPRGRDQWGLAWAALVLLNAGTLTACAGHLATDAPLVAGGRAAEAAAALAFALHAWGRARPSMYGT